MVDFAKPRLCFQPVLPAHQILDTWLDCLAEVSARAGDIVLLGYKREHEAKKQKWNRGVRERIGMLGGQISGRHDQDHSNNEEPKDAGFGFADLIAKSKKLLL